MWRKTRDLFPEEVTKRLQGESVDIPDRELDFSYVQSRQHYGDGELRKEYEIEVNWPSLLKSFEYEPFLCSIMLLGPNSFSF